LDIKPALVPLETKENWPRKLQGLTLENVTAAIFIDGKKDQEQFGDMLFTHFGISGPIILKISSRAIELMREQKVEISIDMKPALDKDKLEQRLHREFATKKIYKSVMSELLPKKMVHAFVSISGIPKNKQANQINKQQRRRIIELLKDLRVTVSGHRPLKEAVVTKGGVSTAQIDPQTMESKLVKGLYFSGEIIDVDGQTGGYNLQAAFSTGFVAGENAAKATLG
jgi:predicted Rossmann fold flavoprotein